MNTKLHEYLLKTLGNKQTATVPIAEFESLAGDEWLMEVSMLAEHLKAEVKPHPRDTTLAIIERESGIAAE